VETGPGLCTVTNRNRGRATNHLVVLLQDQRRCPVLLRRMCHEHPPCLCGACSDGARAGNRVLPFAIPVELSTATSDQLGAAVLPGAGAMRSGSRGRPGATATRAVIQRAASAGDRPALGLSDRALCVPWRRGREARPLFGACHRPRPIVSCCAIVTTAPDGTITSAASGPFLPASLPRRHTLLPPGWEFARLAKKNTPG
jgi:hypothetical protein